MIIPSLPLEIHREIILQASMRPLDPLLAERGPLFSGAGTAAYCILVPRELALVSRAWNVSLDL